MSSIKKISIIGLGLIGGSVAKALKSVNKNYFISALDKEEVLNKALRDKVIDYKCKHINETAGSHLIFIAVPLNDSVDILEKLAAIVDENTIITDVCGVKYVLQKKWETLNSKGVYIGGHPMTGKEKGGYENSDPLLFENTIYILSNVYRGNKRLEDFLPVIKSLGARVMFLDPLTHDRIVANVSHLPQILSVALVNSTFSHGENNYHNFAAGGFKDMTRIASSKFEIWEEVIKQNKAEINSALLNLMSELEEIRRLIESGNFKAIARKFESARKHRDEIPGNTKGFLTPLYDVFVFVKDEPGVIFKISSVLYGENINIKDIELLKIREGTGGTFRLSFESYADAQMAKQLLSSAGFKIQK